MGWKLATSLFRDAPPVREKKRFMVISYIDAIYIFLLAYAGVAAMDAATATVIIIPYVVVILVILIANGRNSYF